MNLLAILIRFFVELFTSTDSKMEGVAVRRDGRTQRFVVDRRRDAVGSADPWSPNPAKAPESETEPRKFTRIMQGLWNWGKAALFLLLLAPRALVRRLGGARSQQ